jgi:DNA-directed RNA polymerase specialized sigma24 family protein
MRPDEDGSVTRWIGDQKAGGDRAAQHLWERYFERLVHLARNEVKAKARRSTAEGEEDAAPSAFDSFCRGATQGRFPLLNDREDLWRLLVVLTVRKALDQLNRQGAAKRGGGRLVSESGVLGAEDEPGGNTLDRLVGPDPTPELAAMVLEQYRRLRAGLRDDTLRQVLDPRMEGYDREEIAARLGCAVRTVTRKLDLIRDAWLQGGS